MYIRVVVSVWKVGINKKYYPITEIGITSQDEFHTSRHPHFANPTHELLCMYVASFALLHCPFIVIAVCCE